MAILSFQPEKVTKGFVVDLNERAQDVIFQRFGIGGHAEKKTLEAIGQQYGITRERVRQIENFAIGKIKQHSTYENSSKFFTELKKIIDKKGRIVSEEEILSHIADNAKTKNHIHFLLVLGDDFTRLKEDDHFHARWTTDDDYANNIHSFLKVLHKEIRGGDLYSEKELLSLLKERAYKEIGEKVTDAVLLSWLKISKHIDSNALGEYGHVSSPMITPRGMRDYAFLVLRKHGSPMHFTEIADMISNYFNRPANAQTAHNELIKDESFVLIGRGLYGLKEWGYMSGTVKNVIESLLQNKGPMSKNDILKAVLKERYVKENTILVNLQNKAFFTKNKNNKYVIVS